MSLVVDIEKHYGTFDLEVAFEAAHETLGFLGASGCGKSLTLRCIAGVETPDAGKIVVNGKTYFDKAPGKKASVNLSAQERKSALLFQNYQLFPNLTVKANIAAGIPREVLKRDGDALIERQLTRFGLHGLEKRYPLQLSGGQQQRVALARMLAAQPAILMLDEPFSALDAHLKSELEQSLLDLFAAYEGTILYVSHDIDEAFRFCDRIAVVSDGTIDEIAPKDELVHEPRSLAAIRLSGCKNTTPARYVSDHRVYLPEWGVEMETKRVVPHDVAWLGVRAYHIKQAREGAAASNAQPNVFRMRCDRVSDSRFERAVMAAFVDEAGEQLSANLRELGTQGNEPCSPAPPENTEQAFLKSHVRWNIDKHITADNALPERGDCVFLTFPPEALYVVTH